MAGPDGFYAARCGLSAYSTSARYAYSADGIMWEARGFHTSADQVGAPSVDEGACNRIAVDSSGGVWLASKNLQGRPFGMVYRGAGDVATEFYTIEHEPTGLRLDREPMMAVSDTEVAVVGSVRGRSPSADRFPQPIWRESESNRLGKSGRGALSPSTSPGPPATNRRSPQPMWRKSAPNPLWKSARAGQ